MAHKLYKGAPEVMGALERLRCNSWRMVDKGQPLSAEPARADALLVEAKLVELEGLVALRDRQLSEANADIYRALTEKAQLVKAQEAYNDRARMDTESLVRLNKKFLEVEADTRRLDRLLREPDLSMVINKYGAGAAGNSCVSIDSREDIDVVLKREREAEVGGGCQYCGMHVGEGHTQNCKRTGAA